MYDQYYINYLRDFSDRFFQESMMEEWFQDRYSPVRIVAQQEAAAERAVSESAAMKASLLAHPEASVKAMCLDPPAHAKGKRGAPDTVVATEPAAATATTTTEEDMAATENAVDMETCSSDIPVASKHLPGHENRTLFIAGIHASCTRSALYNAITQTLADNVDDTEDIPMPERFLFAQPVWTTFEGNDVFER